MLVSHCWTSSALLNDDFGAQYCAFAPPEIRQLAYRPGLQEMPPSMQDNPFRGRRISREMLVEILNEYDWNKAEAGRRVNLSRTTIWKYMKKWNIPLREPLGLL